MTNIPQDIVEDAKEAFNRTADTQTLLLLTEAQLAIEDGEDVEEVLIDLWKAAHERQRSSGECKVNNLSSRICERGTKCCTVYHIPQPPQISGTLTVVLEALAWADGHLDSELLKRAICKVQGALGTTAVPPPVSAAFRRGYRYARDKIDAANKETVMESLEAQSSDGSHDFDKGVRQCLFDEGRKDK